MKGMFPTCSLWWVLLSSTCSWSRGIWNRGIFCLLCLDYLVFPHPFTQFFFVLVFCFLCVFFSCCLLGKGLLGQSSSTVSQFTNVKIRYPWKICSLLKRFEAEWYRGVMLKARKLRVQLLAWLHVSKLSSLDPHFFKRCGILQSVWHGNENCEEKCVDSMSHSASNRSSIKDSCCY